MDVLVVGSILAGRMVWSGQGLVDIVGRKELVMSLVVRLQQNQIRHRCKHVIEKTEAFQMVEEHPELHVEHAFDSHLYMVPLSLHCWDAPEQQQTPLGIVKRTCVFWVPTQNASMEGRKSLSTYHCFK